MHEAKAGRAACAPGNDTAQNNGCNSYLSACSRGDAQGTLYENYRLYTGRLFTHIYLRQAALAADF